MWLREVWNATYGGIPGRLGPWCFATIEPIAGYISAAGLTLGSAARLAVWSTLFGSWLLWRQSTDRMIVNRSSVAACFGMCSQNWTPGSLVEMTPNGPRFWSGRPGFG